MSPPSVPWSFSGTSELRPVAPSGTSTGLGCPGGVLVSIPTYPASPKGLILRSVRLLCDLSMGDAARLLGLTPVQYSGLENGSFDLSDEAWFSVYGLLLADWKQRHPPVAFCPFSVEVSDDE